MYAEISRPDRLGLILAGATIVGTLGSVASCMYARSQAEIADDRLAVVGQLSQEGPYDQPIVVNGISYRPPYTPKEEQWFAGELVQEANDAQDNEALGVTGMSILGVAVVCSLVGTAATMFKLRRQQA